MWCVCGVCGVCDVCGVCGVVCGVQYAVCSTQYAVRRMSYLNGICRPRDTSDFVSMYLYAIVGTFVVYGRTVINRVRG